MKFLQLQLDILVLVAVVLFTSFKCACWILTKKPKEDIARGTLRMLRTAAFDLYVHYIASNQSILSWGGVTNDLFSSFCSVTRLDD